MPQTSSPSRELVLDAAEQLMRQHGYAGLSMRELARLSGLAKSTIYHHFADKRAIFVSVIERNIAALRNQISEAATTPDDFRTRLYAVIETYLHAQSERGLVVMHALRETHDLEVDLCSILRRYRREMFQPVEQIIQEAIDAGECRPVNVEMAVISLYGMIHGFVTHRIFLENVEPDAEMNSYILDLFLHGLVVHDATTPQPSEVRESEPAGARQSSMQPISPSCVPLNQTNRTAE